MAELRRDPVVGRWVIIAVERAARPDPFRAVPEEGSPDPSPCVFCPGNEGLTPEELASVRAGGKNWSARVVRNKFPALRGEGKPEERLEGLYGAMNGIGRHEVVIETSRHEVSLTGLSDAEVRDVLALYKARLRDFRADPGLVYGLVFKNVGRDAGASLEHTHSQIVATPIVPLQVQTELDRCREHRDEHGRCLLCDIVGQERSGASRMVMETPEFVAFAPFAARFPFETHILPKRHLSHFEATDDALLPELARCLRGVLERIEKVVGRPPYNYLIHTSPLDTTSLDYYHWHFEIIPRITRVAGFEWGSGFYINPVPPEEAARRLREAGA